MRIRRGLAIVVAMFSLLLASGAQPVGASEARFFTGHLTQPTWADTGGYWSYYGARLVGYSGLDSYGLRARRSNGVVVAAAGNLGYAGTLSWSTTYYTSPGCRTETGINVPMDCYNSY